MWAETTTTNGSGDVPKYSFECANQECGMVFDRILKVGDHVTHPCPACSMDAPRVIDGGFAFSFEVSPSREGNSGVHKEDYPTADHAVGRDAQRRWEVMHARNKVKETVRSQSGQGALIRRDLKDSTEYSPMSPAERARHRTLARGASRAQARAKGGG